MRVAVAAFAAILAALALARHEQASADQSSPFPSPSPTATVAQGSGGYASFAIEAAQGSGGMIPGTQASPSPRPFAGANATGYALDLLARLSDRYVGTIAFKDVSIHGDDSPIVSRFDGSLMHVFGGGDVAAGIGFAALQRSNIATSANGVGLGAALLPSFTGRISPYASIFFYPSLPAPRGVRGSLSVVKAGLAFTIPRVQGWFVRLGFDEQ
ncbi:MAG TPA: hypothetical protein VEJ20_01510, partial [Candidatus Eremiobacteraceae bacterium]|nr:hypothetical protein [Candidatus Eremiobacteraceae bacterium]